MNEQIKDPLWSLMLSTNDCYPGCGCNDDVFQITSKRISEWVKINGPRKAEEALSQLNQVEHYSQSEFDAFSLQINLGFYSKSDFNRWVNEWRECILQCLK